MAQKAFQDLKLSFTFTVVSSTHNLLFIAQMDGYDFVVEIIILFQVTDYYKKFFYLVPKVLFQKCFFKEKQP